MPISTPDELEEGGIYYFGDLSKQYIYRGLQSSAGRYAGNVPLADQYIFESYPLPQLGTVFVGGIDLREMIDDGLIRRLDSEDT